MRASVVNGFCLVLRAVFEEFYELQSVQFEFEGGVLGLEALSVCSRPGQCGLQVLVFEAVEDVVELGERFFLLEVGFDVSFLKSTKYIGLI